MLLNKYISINLIILLFVSVFGLQAYAEVLCQQSSSLQLKKMDGVAVYSGDPSEGALLTPDERVKDNNSKYYVYEFRPFHEPYPINLICRYEDNSERRFVLPSGTKFCRYDENGVSCL